jgi:hypothetical protein
MIILILDALLINEMKIGNDDIWVVSCFIKDPFIVLLLNTGIVHLIKIDSSYELTLEKELHMDIMISCISLFSDDTPIQHLPTVKEVGPLENKKKVQETLKTKMKQATAASNNREKVKEDIFDDDDMDLYGDSIVNDIKEVAMVDDEPIMNLFDEEDAKDVKSDIDEEQKRQAPVRHWCFVVDDSGTLRVPL